MKDCDYSCGQQASFRLPNGKYCCSITFQKCPEFKKKQSLCRVGIPKSEEHKKNISISLTGRKFSEEHKNNIKINHRTLKGKDHPLYGIKPSDEARRKMSITRKGRPSRFKGLKGRYSKETIEKIRFKLTGKKHTEEFKENVRKRMLNGQSAYMNSKVKNPSKPQLLLFEIVKQLFPSAIINFPFLNYCLDIAIPEIKLVIEYDGYWFHQDQNKDLERQNIIENHGWKVIKYKGTKSKDIVPDLEQVKRDIENIM